MTTTWGKLIKKNVTATVKKGAYYSVRSRNGLRIISINMNYCYLYNWWTFLDDPDPADQLHWFTAELTKAEKLKEKVYILGHIPPGEPSCISYWSHNYHKIIERFENTIVAQFFGHTHFGEFELFYDKKYNRPISIAYVGPSVTTYSYLNPSYTIYTADGDHISSTRIITDGEVYSFNLTKANLEGQPDWILNHSYKKAYNMTSLLPSEWHEVFQRLSSDDQLSAQFFKNMVRDTGDYPICDKSCMKKAICRQVVSRSYDFTMCDRWGVTPSDGNDDVVPEFL